MTAPKKSAKKKHKILGVIPARGGSKSIPKKNIKELLGKPLIAWTIKAALESGALDRVVVSTDSPEIAEVARKFGAEVPFLRPSHLAGDTTASEPVLQHAVTWLRENEKYEPDAVMMLEPTSPSRQTFHVREAAELLARGDCDSVVSVIETSAQYNPHWILMQGENGYAKLAMGGPLQGMIHRRQLLPKAYAKNGAIYLVRTDCLFDEGKGPLTRYGDKVKLFEMEPFYSVDIDHEEDWVEAERVLAKILERDSLK